MRASRQQIRILQGRGAHGDLIGAGAQRLLHIIDSADATAYG